MQISCIAIDDEPLALTKVCDFAKRVPGLNLITTFDDPVASIGWIRENAVDLIFLDIQMASLTGIEFIEATGTDARIIIISAYDQYAIKGYELNVTDYLLKPYSFQRFVQAVNKVMDYYVAKGQCNDANVKEDYIFVKTEYRFERVDLDEILYIEGMKDYLRIVCNNRKIMTLQSFSKLGENLGENRFIRVHKSYIVAIDKIKSVERGVIRIGDQRIPVSNTYRDNLFAKLKL
ncbi:MAG TPA: LytTR family DNA-binding domain-containing protein [Bacteroidales bacterium]|nr:LytTR family DNA-binding domain-containing protein [Bacteroidales bacterium]